MSLINTMDETYRAPLKARIKFKNVHTDDNNFTFDGFLSPDNELNVVYVDAERAIGETGIFNIIVEDSHNLIDQTKLENARVYIEFGKSQSSYMQYLIGFADVFTRRRPRTGYMEYLLTGPTTKIQAAELYISRREASKITNVDDPTVIPESKFNINKIFRNSLTKSSWRPLNKEAIDSGHPQTNWIPDLIDDSVNTNYPVVNEPLTVLWDFWDRLCLVGGSVWDIDYSEAGKEKVLLSYNPALHTGITIKSGDLKTVSDQADKTAYINSNFDVENNWSSDAGTAMRLYSTTIIDRAIVASQTGQTGATNTTFRAIAQQVKIENDQRRITDFAFVLSKVGDPSSPKDRLNGDFVMDSGDNKPTGKVLGTFNIPLSSIDSSPKTVFVNDVDIKVRFLEGSNYVWLRIFQRSNEETTDVPPQPDGNGNPNHGTKHTIKWHHNAVLNSTQALYSATAPEGDMEKKDTLAWNSTNQGPIYAFSIMSNIRRLQARTNFQAANTVRMKESVVDSSFLSDPAAVSTFLSLNLAKTSKARRAVPEMSVTIPNNYLFAPFQWISFNDGLSNVSQELQVQRARYVCSALPGDPQIGALDCTITLGGLWNSLLGRCACT